VRKDFSFSCVCFVLFPNKHQTSPSWEYIIIYELFVCVFLWGGEKEKWILFCTCFCFHRGTLHWITEQTRIYMSSICYYEHRKKAKLIYMLLVLMCWVEIWSEEKARWWRNYGVFGIISAVCRVNSSYETYRFLPFSFSPLGLHVKRVFWSDKKF
jgi:hypothetical protein